MIQTRLEKLLKKQNLDEDAIKAIADRINSVFNLCKAEIEDNRVAATNDLDASIQGIQEMDADEFINRMSGDFNTIEECDKSITVLEKIYSYIFEEIETRKKCKGFSNS